MKLEKDLMHQIKNRLDVYRMTGEVVWFQRLQSGKAKVGSYYINLSEHGTPDWLALVRMRNEGLGALFIEAKSDTGKLSQFQQAFYDLYIKKSDVYILILKDIKELDTWIDKNAKDFVAHLGTKL